MNLFTIGSSKKTAEEFFTTLTGNHIEILIDIRLNNTSQLLGFSKYPDLKYFLEKCHNIRYEHITLFAPTKELLSRYLKDHDWTSYQSEFSRTMKSRPIIESLQKAVKTADNICLLCSESTAERCHRRLVAEYISDKLNGIRIIHL
jgi:uncharacterized protein (DUF488 family)